MFQSSLLSLIPGNTIGPSLYIANILAFNSSAIQPNNSIAHSLSNIAERLQRLLSFDCSLDTVN